MNVMLLWLNSLLKRFRRHYCSRLHRWGTWNSQEKRRGNYLIIKIDANYTPEPIETKQVFGIKFEQKRNDSKSQWIFSTICQPKSKKFRNCKIDLLISMITLKYTQSNSVCYAMGGQTIGVGAGQQSRIHCTRLAGNKADNFWLRRNEKVLNLPFIEGIRARQIMR